MSAPDLVFGYGNPSRGDDALGPLFLEGLRAAAESEKLLAGPDLLTDFQLQPEHALDLQGRRRVLFVDASTTCAEPFELRPVTASFAAPVYTHALEPGALLAIFERIEKTAAPPCWVLAVRGYTFALGDPLSPRAGANLDAALRWARDWLRSPAKAAAEVELQDTRT